MIPKHPNVRLTRRKTADALTEAGFPVKETTLATKATRGGGPTLPDVWIACSLPMGRRAAVGEGAPERAAVLDFRS